MFEILLFDLQTMSGSFLRRQFKQQKNYVLIFTKHFIKYHSDQYHFIWNKLKKLNLVGIPLYTMILIDILQGSILLK